VPSSLAPGSLRPAEKESTVLQDEIRALAQAANFAALTTLFPGGQPQTNVMWVDADEDYILINTEVHRAKFVNVEKDPRVAVAIIDAANPYHYAEVRGTVVETEAGDVARAHIDALAQKYLGTDYGAEVQSERVILKIAPITQRYQAPRG
jgi:PPOX class probable F420-dependent enzyme